jgi:nucleoside-diphosphate-sugar epimerase
VTAVGRRRLTVHGVELAQVLDMRVFVAGAGGVVGSRLVPRLIERGHEVVATTRSPDKLEPLRTVSAKPVSM